VDYVNKMQSIRKKLTFLDKLAKGNIYGKCFTA